MNSKKEKPINSNNVNNSDNSDSSSDLTDDIDSEKKYNKYKIIDINTKIKDSFDNYFSKSLGSLYDLAKKEFNTLSKKSIRVNTLKISKEELIDRLEKKEWNLIKMPFYENGFFISGKRRDIGNILEHNLGYFYVQDASSMIPPLILDPKKGDIVLDIAASPGSKTTQIAQMMENTGVIIANELSTKRLAPLGQNIQKLGITNTVLISRDGRKLKFNFLFDKILLDAPCSGSGTPKIDFLSPLETWNESTVKGLYKMQISLLFKAFSFLKPGGTLVYSTCSMDIYENEYVIHNFLEKEKDAYLEEARLSGLNHTPAILCYNDKELNPEISKTLRIMPQDNKTEGFFIAKIRKKES